LVMGSNDPGKTAIFFIVLFLAKVGRSFGLSKAFLLAFANCFSILFEHEAHLEFLPIFAE
jgi:hypothetical protein